jgi:hypothetical protein
MKFADQTVFVSEKPETVISHLKQVKRETITVSPSSLLLQSGKGNGAEGILLAVSNGHSKLYPVRKSFIFKLLRWYSYPEQLLSRLSTETVLSTANDFLLNIKSPEVCVKLENGEALTITGSRYTDIPDLEILELCKKIGMKSVSRNDFFMSINSNEVCKVQPRVGDDCGFGFNISNSETGFRSLRVSHYVLRYSCSNGAIARVGQGRQKPLIHRNVSREYALNYINESIKQAALTRDFVFEKLKSLGNSESEPEIKNTQRKLSGLLGYRESSRLMNEYKKNTKLNLYEFDGSQYSLFNFITSKAKSFDIYKRAQLEQLAGDLFLSLN